MVVAKFPTSVAEISADTLALKKQTVRYQQGNPADRAVLNRLDLTHYDHAVVLCNSDRDFGCT
jgi:Trk K+ transport system NAD-binding subunit